MRQLFYSAFEKFLVRERTLLLNGVSERCLCFRLGLYLDEERRAAGINGHFVDAEYNRNLTNRVKTIRDHDANIITITCDLILHSRGEDARNDNLIAIEMKKSSRPDEEKDEDRNRLRALTKASYDDIWSADGVTLPEHVCGYQLGVYLELDIRHERFIVEEFEKGEPVNQMAISFAGPDV